MTTLLGLVSMYAINVVLIELRYIPVPSSGQAWTIMPQFLYMSLVAGAIAVLSWNMGNKIITPVNGVLFMNVVPVAAFAVSALSGIVPTPVQLAGAAITVAALVMNNLYQRQRVQRESASPYGHTAAANRGSGRCPGSCPYRPRKRTSFASCPSRKSYPRVAMMQSGQDWCEDDGPRSFNGSSSRRVFAQSQVRARLIVIERVRSQHSLQMPFAKD